MGEVWQKKMVTKETALHPDWPGIVQQLGFVP